MPRNVVLVTTAFPSASVTEEAFITPEIEDLSKRFDRVIIVPLLNNGSIKEIAYPCVTVDWSVADSLSTRYKLLKLPYLFKPRVMRNYPEIIKTAGGVRRFISRALYCMNVEVMRCKLKKIMRRHSLSAVATLFYTFWFDFTTIALAQMGETAPLHIVSRAHGYDIYDHLATNRPPHLRQRALNRMTRLYPASRNGELSLRHSYPGNDDKISMRILGSVKRDINFRTPCHSCGSGQVTFLSVARVSPEKGVRRNLDFVIKYSQIHPEQSVKWIHVGDGPEMHILKAESKSDSVPANLTIELRGAMPNDDVHRIYESESIDWVILFSDTEGGCPISLSEAISYSVPVIANAVGGVPEIVTPDTGITVKPGTDPKEIVAAVDGIMEDEQKFRKLKDTAFIRWKDRFCAKKLREDFVAEISGFINPEKSDS